MFWIEQFTEHWLYKPLPAVNKKQGKTTTTKTEPAIRAVATVDIFVMICNGDARDQDEKNAFSCNVGLREGRRKEQDLGSDWRSSHQRRFKIRRCVTRNTTSVMFILRADGNMVTFKWQE